MPLGMMPTYLFFFKDTATPEIYTLSLHDALPIYAQIAARVMARIAAVLPEPAASEARDLWRSEEHTSELQSRENLVCRLLLEKKKPTQERGSFLRQSRVR